MSSRPRFSSAWPFACALAVAVLALAAVAVHPPRSITVGSAGIESLAPAAPGKREPAPGSPTLASGPPAAHPGAGGGPALQCVPGRNGGATDVGVTPNTIKVGATVVDSGIGAAFLRDARYGMLAIKNRVNRGGGICGRKLELRLVDDGWDPRQGGDYIRNLVDGEKVFALAVVPSSEGLKAVSDAGYLAQRRVPVVGTDGMLIHQYTDPWIFPVAASTISTMHVMAKNAHDGPLGARNFALVYEYTYHFGIEGAYAFNEAVKRLTGSGIPGYSNPTKSPRCDRRFCALRAGGPSYTSEIQTFNEACSLPPKCDFVAMLLEPATALTWIKGAGLILPKGRTQGVQPLFTRAFAEECKDKCDEMWLWTGYFPAVGSNLGRPAVAAYRDAIIKTSSSADYTNTFVEGAYEGMELFVAALRAVGPHLTRERLARQLNSMTFASGLTSAPLRWLPGNHFANVTMQAYSIQYTDRFSGWRDEQTMLADPWAGKDIP